MIPFVFLIKLSEGDTFLCDIFITIHVQNHKEILVYVIEQISSSLPPLLGQQASWPSFFCYWFSCFINTNK